VTELSLLEYRKFSICLQLVHNDPLMIVEEPFLGLDLSSSLEGETIPPPPLIALQ
jgi:ABC-type multidrug transport system ATPase subunit